MTDFSVKLHELGESETDRGRTRFCFENGNLAQVQHMQLVRMHPVNFTPYKHSTNT